MVSDYAMSSTMFSTIYYQRQAWQLDLAGGDQNSNSCLPPPPPSLPVHYLLTDANILVNLLFISIEFLMLVLRFDSAF